MTPLNEEARTECVDMILEVMGYPRHQLFEYPHRDDDSIRYITRAERTLDKILAMSAVPADTVNSVAELDALPGESVILDADNFPYRKTPRSSFTESVWEGIDCGDPLEVDTITFPATVLYRPVVES